MLEWVAYHLSIGFDHIIIAYNDCSDGSDALIRALGKRPDITVFENKLGPEEAPQRAALDKIQKTKIFKAADFYIHLDADEFLNIHTGNQKVDSLALVMGNNDVLSINWACFGPKEDEIASSEWVTKRFKHRLNNKDFFSHTCKSFIRRPKRFSNLRIHGPMKKKTRRPSFVMRDNGKVLEIGMDQNLVVATKSKHYEKQPASYQLAQINHYITKSMPEFRLRRLRGRGVRFLDENEKLIVRHSQEHFETFAEAKILDNTIQPKLKNAQKTALRLLLSPAVALAYFQCKRHRAHLIKEARRPWDAERYEM